jgi:HD-GYP domain-containing protein (c-di-GMP phosphodiesterase class II)
MMDKIDRDPQSAASRRAARSEDLVQLFADIEHAYESTLEGWIRALDLRDGETVGHSRRVVELTVELSGMFGISAEELIHIRRGALLHDIGKMALPDRVLLKPGPLDDQEQEQMHLHPWYAYQMLSGVDFLRPALDIPYGHHERWDGSGYPRGLRGEETPFAARMFAVIDVWDALRSDRPYRHGWSADRVIEHIRSLSGSHFEPLVVEAFESLLSKRGDI